MLDLSVSTRLTAGSVIFIEGRFQSGGLRAETRGLRLVEPTPRGENAAHRKKGHLWRDTS